MAGQTERAPEPVAENDNDYDLIDRLRGAALAGTSDAKSRRSAQLAFDPSIDLEKRMRVIAGLAGEDKPAKPRLKEKGRWSWLPIPLGILTVMTLGAAIAKRAPAPKDPNRPTETVAAQPELAHSDPTHSGLDPTKATPFSGEANGGPKSAPTEQSAPSEKSPAIPQ